MASKDDVKKSTKKLAKKAEASAKKTSKKVAKKAQKSAEKLSKKVAKKANVTAKKVAKQTQTKAQVAKGKVKAATGKAVGNRHLQAEGTIDQIKGRVKQIGDAAKDMIED